MGTNRGLLVSTFRYFWVSGLVGIMVDLDHIWETVFQWKANSFHQIGLYFASFIFGVTFSLFCGLCIKGVLNVTGLNFRRKFGGDSNGGL